LLSPHDSSMTKIGLPHRESGVGLPAADGGFCQVRDGGGPAARADGGDPQGSRPAQVVSRSTVRAADFPLRSGWEVPAGWAAIVTLLEAVTPGAGTGPGDARIVFVPGERFDRPIEVVAVRAPDAGAL